MSVSGSKESLLRYRTYCCGRPGTACVLHTLQESLRLERWRDGERFRTKSVAKVANGKQRDLQPRRITRPSCASYRLPVVDVVTTPTIQYNN